MKYENMIVAGGCYYSETSEFEEYMVVRNGRTEYIHLFRYQKGPVVIHVFYYDEKLNYRHCEKCVPYEVCKDEMKAFYDECVNG